jgi:non-specific serine/threonine protein kinase
MPPALALSPLGRVFIEERDDSFPVPPAEVSERIRLAFERSSSAGLLQLATAELETPLPASFVFWRDFARAYLTQLCHTPGLQAEPQPLPAPDDRDLAALAETAPPMTGIEYLSGDALKAAWLDLDSLVRAEIRGFAGGAQAYLRTKNPVWNLVGRVSFHLAENKRDAVRPFAFLATYTSRVSNKARPQYTPLGRALEEYAGVRNRNALLSLLSPVHRASEASTLIRELVSSGEIFHPLAWEPDEAYRFLRDIPIFESSGILVRVPDWWKAGRPPRPVVSVKIGDRKTQTLGLDALLDFSVQVTLDGQQISESEWKSILAVTQGLVLLKGKWVEIDREKLTEVLQHWENLEAAHRESGISFAEGMRLLAGAGLDRKEEFLAQDDAREWSSVAAGDWLNGVLGELHDPARIQDCEPGEDLKAELRPYQKTGANWLWFMYRLGLGACLADDMGLGKTIQVLSLLLLIRRAKQRNRERRNPSLIVVPASLVANWKAELQLFAPSLSVFFAHPSETPAAALEDFTRDGAGTPPEADVVITTYGMLLRAAWLRGVEWDLVVLDEAQAIKNPSARQTRAAKELKARGRVLLTGTPVENRLSDLWSLFDFACPGLLGSAGVFGRYIKDLASKGQSQYGPVRALVRPYILRRLKTDRRIIADLPDKSEVRAFCPLTKTQAALYEQSVQELARRLETSDGIQRRGIVLSFILRFKQICNHPSQWLGSGEYAPEESGKFLRLRDLVEEVASRQEKVLVFTQFREMTSPLASFLESVFRRPGLVLHGGTPVKKRRALIDDFQRDGGPPFFVLSLKAGGTGLNLTAASHVIHFDRWWNPAVENQATDRAFRIGQHRNVLVHKFVCRGTVEDRIEALVEEKKGMVQELLEEGSEKLLTEMSNEELLRFVALDIRSALAE